jgi:16S rRNA (cytosine967-C5)-methyltransferase
LKSKKTRWAPGAPALADAARAIAAIVFDGRSSDVALAPFIDVADRAAVRAITLGTARWYLRVAPAVEGLLKHPDGVDPMIRALLVAAAHQIEYSRNPPETTANAAVDAVRILKQERAAGLVNAVLRRFVAERATLFAHIDAELPGRTAHPLWLVDMLKQAWPLQAEQILDANNAHPPMTLRVDTSRVSVPDYLAELSATGFSAQAIAWAPTAAQLDRPVPVATLPGFKEGKVSVQDAAAQLSAELLDAQPGMRVMDACAAPGGKTGHLLERTANLAELVAVDIDGERVGRIRDNLKRLQRTATVISADVCEPDAFWDGKPFDRVLLDAPCSSTGVIRRHPDIKLLRRPGDIQALSGTQLKILRACFAMLKPGGRLVYGTCSVLPAENEDVIAQFLEAEPQARVLKPPALPPGAIEKTVGFQLLPGGATGGDGFYYACVEKTTTGT